MQIEFLWFDDCPNHTAARALLSEVLAERGIEAEIDDVNVPDLESGERVKFAGSPSIGIDGADVEPDYEDTGDYNASLSRLPDERGATRRPRARMDRGGDRGRCLAQRPAALFRSNGAASRPRRS